MASGKVRPIRTAISTSIDAQSYHKDFVTFGTRAQFLQPQVTQLARQPNAMQLAQ